MNALWHVRLRTLQHWRILQATREEEHWQRVRSTIGKHLRQEEVWRDEEVAVPDSWQLMAGGDSAALRSLHLRMPNSRFDNALLLGVLVCSCSPHVDRNTCSDLRIWHQCAVTEKHAQSHN